MTGLLVVFVSAFAALSASAASGATEQGLRRGRSLQETLYCNSIGCPPGYIPIEDAMNVECEDDPCEVSQCCMAFCSFHACPDDFIPIAESQTTLCPDSGCTDDLCCVFASPETDGGDSGDGGDGGDGVVGGGGDGGEETPYCNSIPCPPDYIPIDDAMNVECEDDPCEVSQCCMAFCSFHACPDSPPIDDAQTTQCPDSGCTDDLCCT